MKKLSLIALLLLFALHQDYWFWDDSTLILGLPVGLTYHFGLCLAAAIVFRSLCNVHLPDTDRGDA